MTTETGVNNSGNLEDTGSSVEIQNQDVETRTFTQEDVDKIVQARLEKYKKRYDGIDMNEYKSLKQAEEERELEAMKKREEFDKILLSQKEKYSSEINSLRSELTSMKVDGTLLTAASQRGAVNAEQVAQLLRNQVGLDETGRPVVYDKEKNVIYDSETAEPKSLQALVNEFLDGNPHFLKSGPSGVQSNGGQGLGMAKPEVDLASLDLTKPADRQLYQKLRAEGRL
jgi:hypothetical protein